jgi:hypothetical protein
MTISFCKSIVSRELPISKLLEQRIDSAMLMKYPKAIG